MSKLIDSETLEEKLIACGCMLNRTKFKNSESVHDGTILTEVVVNKLKVDTFDKILHRLGCKGYSNYTSIEKRMKIIQFINGDINIESAIESARKNVFHTINRNSPESVGIESIPTLYEYHPNWFSYTVCSPHLGKALHNMVTNADSENFPVLFLVNENEEMVKKIRQDMKHLMHVHMIHQII